MPTLSAGALSASHIGHRIRTETRDGVIEGTLYEIQHTSKTTTLSTFDPAGCAYCVPYDHQVRFLGLPTDDEQLDAERAELAGRMVAELREERGDTTPA